MQNRETVTDSNESKYKSPVLLFTHHACLKKIAIMPEVTCRSARLLRSIHPSFLLSADDARASTDMLTRRCIRLLPSMLAHGHVTCGRFRWLTALHGLVLLPSSVSAVQPLRLPLLFSLPDIDILNTVVVLWCLSALTHFDSGPFSPSLPSPALPLPTAMSLCRVIVCVCMGLHASHMKGWLWLTSQRRRKEGLGGSASRPTLMVNPVVSLLCVRVGVRARVCCVVKFNTKKMMMTIINIPHDDTANI